VTALGPGRRQNLDAHAAVKIVTLFMYGLFYDAVSSSYSVHVGEKKTYIAGRGRWRRSKLNVKGTNTLDYRQHFVLLCVVWAGGGGETAVSGEDPAPVPRCSIGVSRGDVQRSDPGLRGEMCTSCHLSCETSILCSEYCSCLVRCRFVP
jgi:hypothetical protein